METKKSKVTNVQEKTSSYNGNNGVVFYHKITFENGDTGQYGSKSETCEKFTVGQEADYTIEKKENGQYVNYVIKPIQGAVNSFNGGSAKVNKDSGIITYLSCLSSACLFYQRNLQATEKDVLEFTETAWKKAMEKKTNS